MKQLRGKLTERIKTKSKELLGYEITQIELRLMAHLVYLFMNEQKINPTLINTNEIHFLNEWVKKKYTIIYPVKDASILTVVNKLNKIYPTKKFWDIINEIIYLGYVDL